MSVCVDTMVNKSFYNQDFINKNLIPVLDRMSVLNVNKVVIPLLEDSSVDDPLIREEFLKNIIPIGEKYSFIEFCFEFESNKEIVLDVVSKKSNFFITYDTGNFTSHYKQKINHEDLILSFGDKIKNVHIKDRTYNSISKKFSFGDTDFMTIFKTLKKINYSDNFILQLCRDSEGDEKKYIEETYKKIKINYTF
jgi:hexulose-6-phosphate isomerase